MAFLGDYHTHTYYSRNGKKLHGKGSVLQNAMAAKRAGLTELAITDHGYTHVYGVTGESAFAQLKAEAERAERITGVRIYVGLENNLDPRSGTRRDVSPFIQCPPKTLDELDIIQGGYHAFIGTPKLINNTWFWVRNVILKFLPGRKKLIEHNTAAYKRMIDEYPIDFIGHLNRGILANAVEVAEYAAAHGVYIELNGRHKSLKESEVKQMVAKGVKFICNSDAHSPDRVGKMTYGIEMIKKCGIPYEQIVNWDKLPEFRSAAFNAARAKKTDGGGDADDKRS